MVFNVDIVVISAFVEKEVTDFEEVGGLVTEIISIDVVVFRDASPTLIVEWPSLAASEPTKYR